MIYTREQLIHEILEIIREFDDNYNPDYEVMDRKGCAEKIADLIATLDDKDDPATQGIFP